MKVFIALTCVIAAAAAFPSVYLVDDGEDVYSRPVRQLNTQPRPFPNRRQGADDLDTAADTGYGHAVSTHKNKCNFHS